MYVFFEDRVVGDCFVLLGLSFIDWFGYYLIKVWELENFRILLGSKVKWGLIVISFSCYFRVIFRR